MGKKTDFFTGKRFNTSKFKILAKLALSRISILKNQHQARSSYAQSDVIELLNLGHHQCALLRVEYVIIEQNMVDMFCMIERCCNQLIDKVKINRNKACPDELKGPISILFLAAPRCGEFPELRQIRNLFESWFGADFASHATNKNPKIIQKLSTQRPSLENRMMLLEMLACENGISLKLDKGPDRYEETRQAREHQNDSSNDVQKPNQHEPNKPTTITNSTRDYTSESTKTRMDYRNGADAALEAFESFEAAAHAAAVARLATRLSQSEVSDRHADLGDHDHIRNKYDKILSNSDESLQSSSLNINRDTVPQATHTYDDSDIAAEIKVLDEKRKLTDKPHQIELPDKKTIQDASKDGAKKELTDE